MSTVIGIDPGQACGVAVFVGGKLQRLYTVAPHELLGSLRMRLEDAMRAPVSDRKPRAWPLLVVFEDSRLQSHVWNAAGKRGSLRIARNLGMVDGICAQIEAWCEGEGVECIPVSPKSKGAKLDASAFRSFTGWEGRTNQHERDAAMVAWAYRNFTPQNASKSAHKAQTQGSSYPRSSAKQNAPKRGIAPLSGAHDESAKESEE